jgi:hypothetical protein
VRTTIRIDEALYRRTKARAAETGRTVSEVIEDAIREALRPRPRAAAAAAPLPVYGGSGTMPGVDLASNERLRDLVDEDLSLDALR